jgi:malonyl-CoA/methylmalonyl-CoA synthetase
VMTITERFTDILVDHPRKVILSDSKGTYTTSQLYNATQYILSEELHGKSQKGNRIAVFCHPGLSYVSAMLAGWMSGAMMVPLCITHPEGELLHILEDAKPALIIAD